MAADRTPVSEMDSLSIVPKIVGPIKTYCSLKRGESTRSIQHYLGHKNIQNTVPYTEMATTRFKDFWSD